MDVITKGFAKFLVLLALALLRSQVVTAQSIEIEVTTEKGATPVYETGDVMQVQVKAFSDTNVFCFYRQAGGQVFRIFPNRFASNPRIMAGQILSIPDSASKFNFRFTTPLSLETVRCYSSGSNLLLKLPAQISALELSPLTGTSLADIDRYLSNGPGEDVSSATLVIAVSGQ